jgi:hypothetical protein
MLTKAELKYHTQEKETLAIVWSMSKFKSYLLGAKFIVRTDHLSLQYLKKAEKGRLARWAICLDEFDFEIKYRKGKANINADVASRWTKTPAEPDWNLFPYYSDPVENYKLITNNGAELKILNISTIVPKPTFDLKKAILGIQNCDSFRIARSSLIRDPAKPLDQIIPKGYKSTNRKVQFMIHQNLLSRMYLDIKTKKNSDSDSYTYGK